MTRASRYIIRQLTLSTLLVTFVLAGVAWLVAAVRAVENIVNQGLSMKTFFSFTMLQMPNAMGLIFFFAFFIAVLFVYTRLNSDREIIVRFPYLWATSSCRFIAV